MYTRYLNLDLPKKQSAFLWGARKTGKSTYLKEKYPNAKRFDLLDSALETRFTKAPWEFREEVLYQFYINRLLRYSSLTY